MPVASYSRVRRTACGVPGHVGMGATVAAHTRPSVGPSMTSGQRGVSWYPSVTRAREPDVVPASVPCVQVPVMTSPDCSRRRATGARSSVPRHVPATCSTDGAVGPLHAERETTVSQSQKRVCMVLTIMLGMSLATPALTQTPTTPPPSEGPPVLTEVERLRLDNHALKIRVVQLEQQVQAAALTEERATLDAALRAAYPGWRMDWQTGQLVPATPPAAETPPR
jgi:hypothetical protein